MKYSDYLTVDPAPKKITQAFNIRDENREALLEREIVDLTGQLKKYADQTGELEQAKKQQSILTRDKQDLANRLANTNSTVEILQEQLENETQLKQNIKTLEQQNETHQRHLDEMQESSKTDILKISKQEKEIMDLTTEKILLETYQQELRLKTKYAEQKQEDAASELKYIKNRFSEIEDTSTRLMEEFVTSQKELSSNIDQRRALRNQVHMLEEELDTERSVKNSLHESITSLQEFYTNSQNQLHVSEHNSSQLDDTVKNLMTTLTNLEQENSYLVDKERYLEAMLAKPTYMSQSLIERTEGFKMPFSGSASNIRKKYLGTGKPTLLKFKPKEEVSDGR